jgi:Uma2 family endonuclease
MTYTLTRYQDYQDYLDNCDLVDGDYYLLSTGEVIQLPPEEDRNIRSAIRLFARLMSLPDLTDLVRRNETELEVPPLGDKRLSRKPDVMVLRAEHIALMDEARYSAVRLGMPAPVFVAEMVSPGGESSDNYQRDYVWKREQYQAWGIPEYWIIDRHRSRVTVLVLEDGIYQETVYTGNTVIQSVSIPGLFIKPTEMLV